jgi:hypothetical protein
MSIFRLLKPRCSPSRWIRYGKQKHLSKVVFEITFLLNRLASLLNHVRFIKLVNLAFIPLFDQMEKGNHQPSK